MSESVACAHCKNDRQMELVRSTPGGFKLYTCSTCSRDTLVEPAAKILCMECGSVGTHTDACSRQTLWGV